MANLENADLREAVFKNNKLFGAILRYANLQDTNLIKINLRNTDLRNANLNKECVINISAIFGGITLLVPSNVNVKVVSTSIFGGVDGKNKYKKDNEITIYINATCLFGGVDIR